MNRPIVWPLVKIKQITRKIGSGATPRGGKNSYKSEGISLIRSLNVYDFRFDYEGLAFIDDDQAEGLSNVEVERNDILLNITGASVARCCIVPDNVLPARVNQHVAIVRIDPDHASPHFVLNVINSPRYKHHLLTLAQGGATREALTKEKIENFKIPLPPLPTQRKIAAVLSAYDDLIENNNRRIQILEEMAQAIYRQWFVEYKFPGHEDIPLVDSGTELGEIPEGWKLVRISDIAEIYRGKSYRSHELLEEGGLPFLNLKCVDRDGGFREDGIKRFQGKFKETQTALPGDIIIALTDMTQERRIIARAARVPDTGDNYYVMSMDLAKVIANRELSQSYLYSMLRFSTFPHQVKEYANGVNVLHLSPKYIEDHTFFLPPKPLTDKFGDVVEQIYQLIDNLNKKNANLRATRDLLLPRLVSGEVEV